MTKNKQTGRYRSRLNSLIFPDTSPFSTKYLIIYPNMTKDDMIQVSKVPEQQKN